MNQTSMLSFLGKRQPIKNESNNERENEIEEPPRKKQRASMDQICLKKESENSDNSSLEHKDTESDIARQSEISNNSIEKEKCKTTDNVNNSNDNNINSNNNNNINSKTQLFPNTTKLLNKRKNMRQSIISQTVKKSKLKSNSNSNYSKNNNSHNNNNNNNNNNNKSSKKCRKPAGMIPGYCSYKTKKELSDQVKSHMTLSKWTIEASCIKCKMDCQAFRFMFSEHGTIIPCNFDENSEIVICRLNNQDQCANVFGKSKIKGGSMYGTYNIVKMDIVFIPNQKDVTMWFAVSGW